MQTAFALAHAGLAGLPCAMPIGVAPGAPGGRHSVNGRLPPLWRGLAPVQAALLVNKADAVLARAEPGPNRL